MCGKRSRGLEVCRHTFGFSERPTDGNRAAVVGVPWLKPSPRWRGHSIIYFQLLPRGRA